MRELAGPFPVGSLIQGRYTVLDLLSENASGAVYLVKDKGGRGPYVLKEAVYSTRKEQHIFPFKEAFLKKLKHPALPRIYRVIRDGKRERMYILMDYIEGNTLDVLQQQLPDKQIPFSQALTLISPIVNAVSYLHQQRPPLVHGNIKPSNILVPKTGGSPVLVNFGGAKELASGTTPSRQNTSNFLAPEQYQGRVSVYSDVYALGAILYTLLTGVVPPSAVDRAVRVEQKEPDPLLLVNSLAPSVHSIVAQVIHRAMSIHSHDRFSSVEQFWETLWQMILVNATASQLSMLTTTVPIEEDTGQNEHLTLYAEPTWPVPPLSEDGPELDDAPTVRRPRSSKLILPEPEQEIVTPSVNPVTQEESVSSTDEPPEAPLAFILASPVEDKLSLNTRDRSFIHRPKKLRLRLFLFLGIAFVLSIALGSGLWLSTVEHRVPVATVLPPRYQSTATPSSATHPPSRATATPNPVSGSFPNIARLYNGTIYDIAKSVKTKMSLTGVQQQHGNIRGNFSGLGRTSSFRGTISTTGHVHFTIVGNGHQGAITLDGSMESGGNFAGTYCNSNNQVGQCSDYGLWSVSPASLK